jgi:hypothetical protein
MKVLWIDAPTAYRALRDGGQVMVTNVPTELHTNDVVAIGEPWALRRLSGSLVAMEYRQNSQSVYVFDEAIRAESERWIQPEGGWHTEMTPWAVRRWARIVELFPNAADGSLAAVIKQTVASQ